MNKTRRDFLVTIISTLFYFIVPGCKIPSLFEPLPTGSIKIDQLTELLASLGKLTVEEFIRRVCRQQNPIFSWSNAWQNFYLTGLGAHAQADFHYWVKNGYNSEWQFASVAMKQIQFNPKIHGLMVKRGNEVVILHQPISTL